MFANSAVLSLRVSDSLGHKDDERTDEADTCCRADHVLFLTYSTETQAKSYSNQTTNAPCKSSN